MKRILVIDDDEQIRLMLRMTLERNGFEVCEAGDGREGLRRFCTEQPDLVITDLVMPEKEGIETIMEIRQHTPDVKIIAISGGGKVNPQNYLELAHRLGAQRTFSKPVDIKELLNSIVSLLESP